MPEIKGMQVRKKEYRFDVKKRYQNVQHYKARQRQPIDVFKDKLRSMFAGPKAEARPKGAESSAAPPPSGFNFKIVGVALLVALLILGLGWLYISAQLQQRPGVFQPSVEKPVIESLVTGGDVMTSGDLASALHNAMLIVEFQSSNIDAYFVNLTTYEGRVPSEVFMLRCQMVEANTYPQFSTRLRSILSRKGVMLNEITVSQLETLPAGALVVAPCGVMPQELLGVKSGTDFSRLVDRGVVFLYIGQPFTRMHTGSGVASTPKEVLDRLQVSFDENAQLASTGGFTLYQPLYSASGRAGWESSLLSGSVSTLKRGDGAFLFMPQTLDGGWRNDGSAAAQDVSMFILDYPWLAPNSKTKSYQFNFSEEESAGEMALFTNAFEGTSCSVKAELSAVSSALKSPLEKVIVVHVNKSTRGELYVEGGSTVVPTNITNTQVRMNARLMEPEPAQPNMFLVITDPQGNDMQRIPRGPVNVQAIANFDVPLYVDQGEYLVSLSDDSGRTYARTYLKVVSIEVGPTVPRPRGLTPSQYPFSVTMDGEPAMLDSIHIEVDGGKFGQYDFNDVSSFVVDVAKYTNGDELPIGNHTFEFTAGGLTKSYSMERKVPDNPFMKAELWAVLLFAGGIIGIGMFLARQEVIRYFVDIPDFPPVARTKIPLSSDAVMSVFIKVNEGYRWKNTPLNVNEVRNGFKNIFYQGKPVYISDYNVEYLLEELEKKKLIGSFLEYYCPSGWALDTGRSIRYLATMRKLRDICVNNAIPFTGLGESEAADSDIKVVGQDMFLHFYEKGGDMRKLIRRALGTVGRGITIVLFKDEAEKDEFKTLLSSHKAPLILKIESEGSSSLLLTMDEFEQMLAELKAV